MRHPANNKIKHIAARTNKKDSAGLPKDKANHPKVKPLKAINFKKEFFFHAGLQNFMPPVRVLFPTC